MKRLITLLLVAAAMTGCASLQYAGTASYSVKPFADKAGNVLCCEVAVFNGKEIASLDAHIQKTGTDYTVDLKETGVAAFKGQEITAGVAGEGAKVAGTAAMVAGGVLAAPAIAPIVGGAMAAGTVPAAAAGVAGGALIQKTLTKP